MKKVAILIEVRDDVTPEAVREEIEYAVGVMENEGLGEFPPMVNSVTLPENES